MFVAPERRMSFPCDDENRSGGARNRFLSFQGGDDFDVHQIFEALIGEIDGLLLRLCRTG